MRSALAATFLALVAALSATASITVSITKPQANQIVGDQLAIEATVTSTNQLQSVTATVADRNTALTFSNSKWTGSLSLAGLPHGNTTLTVTATDIFNNSQSAQRVFRHDTPPALTITAPLQDTVARPLVRITVTCTDDGPGGCQSLEVRLPDDTVLIEAVSSIDQYISLEDFDGTFVDLEILATDSAPQATSEIRRVWVDSSPRLNVFRDLPGLVVDVAEDRILYLDPSGNTPLLKIRDIATEEDTVIPEVPGKIPTVAYSPLSFIPSAFLSPRGAIFEAQAPEGGNTDGIFEWQDDTLITIPHYPMDPLQVEGSFAVWTGAATATYDGERNLYRRNLVTGLTTEIGSDPPAHFLGDVAEDGTVAYYRNEGFGTKYRVFRYDGLEEAVSSPSVTYDYLFPQTDGTNTVYIKQITADSWAVMRHDGTTETEIAPARTGDASFPITWEYQVRNDWIAFTRYDGAGADQVWRIAPDDEEEQLSFFGSSSIIDYLAPDGEVMFSVPSGDRFLSTHTGNATFVSSWQGRSYKPANEWYVAIGRTVFTVGDEAGTLTTVYSSPNPSANGASVTLTAVVTGDGPTGTVTFKDGSTTLGSSPLVDGEATLSTSALSTGAHQITAVYSGDGSNLTSTSDEYSHEVLASGFGAPQNLTATFTGGNVVVDWSPVAGAEYYTIARSVDNGAFDTIASTPTRPYTDSNTTPYKTYLYKVRAVASGPTYSAYGNVDIATTVTFTNDPLVAGTDVVSHGHINELRTAVNAVRSSAGLSAATFTDHPLTAGAPIKAIHIQELREALDAGRAALGLAAISYTDPVLTAGTTGIKAAHVQELREGCK